MKHTPGPWRIDGRSGYEALEIHAKNRRIAKSLYHGGSEDSETDANARRIVACVNGCEGINPDAVADLLVACKKAAPWIHEALEVIYSRLTGEPFEEDTDMLLELYAAIAKAEGEE